MSSKKKIAPAPQSRPRPKRRRTAALNRHVRCCAICRHKHREAIDHDILHWRSPADIAEEFKLYGPRTVYRHAHATGLWVRRRKNFRDVLESIIERASEATVTGNSVIKAVMIHGRINDQGKYVEPPRQSAIRRCKSPEASEDSTSHAERLETAPSG